MNEENPKDYMIRVLEKERKQLMDRKIRLETENPIKQWLIERIKESSNAEVKQWLENKLKHIESDITLTGLMGNPIIKEWQDVCSDLKKNESAIGGIKINPIPSHALALGQNLGEKKRQRRTAGNDGRPLRETGKVIAMFNKRRIYENPYREILQNDTFTGPEVEDILAKYGNASRSTTPTYVAYMMEKGIIERLGYFKSENGRGRGSYKYKVKRVRLLKLDEATDMDKQKFIDDVTAEREMLNHH